ncbi:porin [Burkholderia pyrrocinia]|uniref:porin n=1 Tax=Burkholderia pyrrocinia TaxID=60550 RepID=UPI003D9A9402
MKLFGTHDTVSVCTDSENAALNDVHSTIGCGAGYQFTPYLFGGVAYDYTRGGRVSGRDGATYHQVAAGLDYFLSKRTDVYLTAVYQRASGSDSTGRAAVAAINGPGASANDRQFEARIGMRHTF